MTLNPNATAISSEKISPASKHHPYLPNGQQKSRPRLYTGFQLFLPFILIYFWCIFLYLLQKNIRKSGLYRNRHFQLRIIQHIDSFFLILKQWQYQFLRKLLSYFACGNGVSHTLSIFYIAKTVRFRTMRYNSMKSYCFQVLFSFYFLLYNHPIPPRTAPATSATNASGTSMYFPNGINHVPICFCLPRLTASSAKSFPATQKNMMAASIAPSGQI